MALFALGTRVFRKPDGTVVIVAPQIDYQPKPDELMVSEVRRIDVHLPCDGPITAEIEVFPNQDVVIQAIPYYAFHGRDGKTKQIRFVEFDDNTRWFPGDRI